MWNAFNRKFRTDPPTESFSEVSEKLKELVLEEVNEMNSFCSSQPQEFKISITDANVFDAQINSVSFDIDHRPTGKVFPPDLRIFDGVQVDLQGISRDGKKKVKASIGSNSLIVSSSEAQKHFSITHLVKIIVGVKSSSSLSVLDSTLTRLSKKTLLAIKLAGDWGQVENCRRYGKIFVTQDKIAAT